MDNAERDKYIRETHDAIMTLVPDVDGLKQVVYGNGKPGLKEDMAVVKVQHVQCAREKAKRSPFVANCLSLAAVVVALFTFLKAVK